MGDSVENQSPADDTAAATRPAEVNEASDVDATTVDHSEVQQSMRCLISISLTL